MAQPIILLGITGLDKLELFDAQPLDTEKHTPPITASSLGSWFELLNRIWG